MRQQNENSASATCLYSGQPATEVHPSFRRCGCSNTVSSTLPLPRLILRHMRITALANGINALMLLRT